MVFTGISLGVDSPPVVALVLAVVATTAVAAAALASRLAPSNMRRTVALVDGNADVDACNDDDADDDADEPSAATSLSSVVAPRGRARTNTVDTASSARDALYEPICTSYI